VSIRLTVLGDCAGNALLSQAGCEVRANVRPAPGELVLVGVSARFGVLRSTFEALKVATGHETGHLGIWLTEVDLFPNAELLQLTELETRGWLESIRVIPFGAGDLLPAFRSDEPALAEKIAEFAQRNPRLLTLGTPDDTPDW
jgi:hypothetical protein